MRRSLIALTLLACGLLPAKAGAVTCTTTVSTVAAAESAVSAASAGDAVCLADGTYGRVVLNATKSAPGVTLQAENPGDATINGVDMYGSNLTVANLRITASAVTRPNSAGMTISHNLIVGSRADYGVMVCPATPPDTCDDVTVSGNIFDGSFDEDAIRANVYHDADADGHGLLVEDNEFRGNEEWGGHNDVFQSVWVGDHLTFRGNYLHDFGGQGLLVKDQGTAINGLVVENNLVVRQNLPCDPDSLCPTWQLGPFQVFGPIANGRIEHNTIWPTDPSATKGGGPSYLRDSGWSSTTVSDNVIDAGGMDATTVTGSNNTRCTDGGGWAAWPGSTTDCSPAFIDPANGDYRQSGGRGVDWKVSDKQFGPVSSAPVDHQPTASFNFSPTAPQTGEQVTFDATGSTCQDAPCTYAWTDEPPGGGVWALGSGSTLQFTFTGAGTKYVTLRVTDADGDVDTVEHDVVVSNHTTLLGFTSYGTNDDYNPDGTAEAFQFTAGASGTVKHLWLYVEPNSTAATLHIGLYASASNHPQTLLTSANATPTSGWNDVTVPSASVTSGTKYWIAVLGTGGTLRFRDGSTSNGRAEGSAQTTLTQLPATWSTGTNWPGSWPLSGYATT